MKTSQIRNCMLILALSWLGFACSDTINSTSSNSVQLTVNGRVESSGGADQDNSSEDDESTAVEGAVVTAAQVTADGSLETLGNAETQTSASGEFTLKIKSQGVADAADKVVVVVEKESQQWKAFVSQKVESGSTVDIKPISIESTGETSVYQEVIANGETDLVSKADIESYIGTAAAAELQGSEEATAEFASALAAEARTKAEILATQSSEVSEEQMAGINEAKARALADLNAKLNASADQSAKAEAYKTFYQSIITAHADAEVNAVAYAEAKEAACHSLIENITSLSENAQAEVRAHASVLAAIAVDQAVQARLKAESASESTVNAVAQAGTQLRADVFAKTTATEDEVEGLFQTYNEAVVNALEQEYSANADLIVTANSQINSDTGAKATLESSIEANVDTNTVVDAYTTFYSSVDTVVSDVLSVFTGAEAELFTDVMILINISN